MFASGEFSDDSTTWSFDVILGENVGEAVDRLRCLVGSTQLLGRGMRCRRHRSAERSRKQLDRTGTHVESEMTITDDTAMMEPRYQELATFMRAPYRPDLIDVDIAMYGIAYDGGVTNRPGARHGPREIRNQSSLMRAINHATTVNPYELCSVADVGDVRFERVYDNAAVNDDIEAFVRSIVAAGAVPLAAGGDHSVTFPIFRALATPDAPIGMIHIDAHTDTWGPFKGEKFHHGSPFRLAVESGLLDPPSNHSDRHPRGAELGGRLGVLPRQRYARRVHRRVLRTGCRGGDRGSQESRRLKAPRTSVSTWTVSTPSMRLVPARQRWAGSRLARRSNCSAAYESST